jgi:aryl-alcohol dehydrogenase-like predicted oxidoreductase
MAIIGLGTVQLGLPYGNQAQSELMPLETAYSILDDAIDRGISFFDTAIAYGESESRLGLFGLTKKRPDALISTKIPVASEEVFANERRFFEFVSNHCRDSLKRLGMSQHRLLQFHQCDEKFLRSRSVVATFQRLIETGTVGEIGVSVYSLEQARMAISTGWVKWLQVPVNLADVRFLDPVFLAEARRGGVRLIVRSAVLQGVLTDGAPLPPVKKSAELGELRRRCQAVLGRSGVGLSLEEAGFRMLFGNYGQVLEVVLIGVDSPNTLRLNIEIINRSRQPLPENLLAELAATRQYALESSLINPALWNI